jgi:hypothetical protein
MLESISAQNEHQEQLASAFVSLSMAQTIFATLN